MEDPSETLSKGRFTISAPRDIAEDIRAVIMENGLFDPDRSIGRADSIDFPILLHPDQNLNDIKDILGDLSDLVVISDDPGRTLPREHHTSPMMMIRKGLSGSLDPAHMGLLPEKWDMIGDCLVLKLPEGLSLFSKKIASVYQEVLGARYSLLDRTGIQGDLREPTFEPITAPEDGEWEVIHVENGVRFSLDPRKIMFSSGNVDERIGIVDIVKNGPKPPRILKEGGKEIIIDMFAGIGYFTLPISMKCDIGRIYAIEKNPNSYYYLDRNIRGNRVSLKVTPIHGDNRSVGPDEKADRIIMGYVGGTVDFIGRALDLSSSDGCIIHLHDTIKIEDGVDRLYRNVDGRCNDKGYSSKLLSWRRVKSYAPRIDHVVLDILIKPEDDVKV